KNWLWLGFEEGARAGVVLLSLVQSCKELGINPLLYLRDVLPAISSTPASRVGDLTPKGWKRHQERLTENVRIRNVIPGVLQWSRWGGLCQSRSRQGPSTHETSPAATP
ncbi:MAG: transposase domain-containing protein, partial [Planctomycetota bacterium]